MSNPSYVLRTNTESGFSNPLGGLESPPALLLLGIGSATDANDQELRAVPQ